jgi:hypothetical protein
MTRCYSELIQISDFTERYRYLALRAAVGAETFGYERYLNQTFYASTEWRRIRNYVIARDWSCDLGFDGYEIGGQIYIHHMNPMTADDIRERNPAILDPEFLISTTHKTHNAIHYGDEKQLPRPFGERRPGDTLLWKPISRSSRG